MVPRCRLRLPDLADLGNQLPNCMGWGKDRTAEGSSATGVAKNLTPCSGRVDDQSADEKSPAPTALQPAAQRSTFSPSHRH